MEIENTQHYLLKIAKLKKLLKFLIEKLQSITEVSNPKIKE